MNINKSIFSIICILILMSFNDYLPDLTITRIIMNFVEGNVTIQAEEEFKLAQKTMTSKSNVKKVFLKSDALDHSAKVPSINSININYMIL